ncbi:phosphatase [Paenarthrobacter sp. DKR-5]|uniref:phosphatase n=1 Tax=Paenarthrobacter sp. DKR-5 TaxID=2835535 RepID=UPI0027DD35C2|nr:phosphatase [Paenarthrobacter sp. DKR-5]
MHATELAEYLDRVRITGQVATTRENNLANFQGFVEGNEHLHFGVRWTRDWTFEEVADLMHRRAGTSPDLDHRTGQDTIDSGLAVAALERYAVRLGKAARDRQRVLFATGHPGGLFPVYARLAAALREAGADVLALREGNRFLAGDIRQISDVLMWHQHGNLMHTHFAEPMRVSLAHLGDEGHDAPDLVVADHGWAGFAASEGIDTIGIADCNDPGLFVSEEQGQLQVAVPLDDNVTPGLYAPMVDFILDRAGLQ